MRSRVASPGVARGVLVPGINRKGNILNHCDGAALGFADGDLTAILNMYIKVAFSDQWQVLTEAYAAGHR